MSGSLFFDLSNNANKLRKSYVNGFVDISGNVLVRNDHTLGFYKETVQKKPHYTLDSDGLTIFDVTNAAGDFSTQTEVTTANLKTLSGVTANVGTSISTITNQQNTHTSGISNLVSNLARTDLSLNTLPNLDPSEKVTFSKEIDVNGFINQV
jgi:hypothetical protein